MSRRTLLIILGLLIAGIPFVGLPYLWLMILLPVLGLLTVVLGLTLSRSVQKHSAEFVHDSSEINDQNIT